MSENNFIKELIKWKKSRVLHQIDRMLSIEAKPYLTNGIAFPIHLDNDVVVAGMEV